MFRSFPSLCVITFTAGVLAAVGFLIWRPQPFPADAPALGIAAPKHAAFSPLIRVNVTPPADEVLTIAVDGKYEVRLPGSNRVLGKGDFLTQQPVSATLRGLRIGLNEYPSARIEIHAEKSPAIWVGRHQYRGTVRIYRRPGRSLLAVNVIPLEDYLASVVDSEMPADFPDEARKAQAVVARTYALAHMQSEHPFFDVHATTQSQNYLGYQYWEGKRRLAGESSGSRRIVAETAGQVCTCHNKLFCTYYSAVCGGQTTDGGTVFADAVGTHPSVPCQWCREAARYRWTITIPRETVEARLREKLAAEGKRFGRLVSIRPVGTAANPTAWEVGDTRGRYRFDRGAWAQLLPASLPSSRFTCELAGDNLVLHGRGHGHGVGLCQWGARGMALAGKSSFQILKHYYPTAQLIVLDSAEGR